MDASTPTYLHRSRIRETNLFRYCGSRDHTRDAQEMGEQYQKIAGKMIALINNLQQIDSLARSIFSIKGNRRGEDQRATNHENLG